MQQVNTDAIKMFFNNVDGEIQTITKNIDDVESMGSIDYDKLWGDVTPSPIKLKKKGLAVEF